MAKLFLSLSGEGRGHATRMRAVVESLRHEHEVFVFTSGRAFQFLAPLYRGTRVHLRRIPTLQFGYRPSGGLHYRRTLAGAVDYARRLPRWVAHLSHTIRREHPDLVITDFEPALPRAARRTGVPFLSLNHQHFLLTYDLRSLPWWLRFHALYMGWIVRAYYSGQAASIVSSFYFPPLRPGVRQVTQVGVLLRRELVEAPRVAGRHLLVYFRRQVPANVLRALHETGRPVKVYGLGARPAEGRITFEPVSENGFVDDLIHCEALVSTAGNQLVGEALSLGKPVFAMPEPANYEQYINAHFLAQTGAGDWSPMTAVDAPRIERFLGRLETFRGQIPVQRLNGLPAALEVIRSWLPGGSARAQLALPASAPG